MKILLIIPALVGFDLFLSDFSKYAIKQGHDVLLAGPLPEGGLSETTVSSGVRFCHVDMPRGMNPLQHLVAASQLRCLVRTEKPDVVQVHFSAAAFTVALAKGRHWPKVYATIHGLIYPLAAGLWKFIITPVEVLSLKRMDHVNVLTEDDRISLERYVGAGRAVLYDCFGCGCDIHRFDSAAVDCQQTQELMAKHGIQPSDFVYIFVGRKVEFKGFGLLAKAFLRLSQSHDNAKLLLVGAYDPLHLAGLNDDEMLALRKNSNIIDVEFTDKVEDYLAISDLMVFPSNREGLAVCLMESLSMGVPVVTCDSRGCKDVVRDGVDGWVVKTRSVDCIFEAMEQAISKPQLLDRLSSNAVAGRNRFDRKGFIQENLKILCDMS